MQLETLYAAPTDPNDKPPILLVHGAWHGAWCWQGNFLEHFAARGFETHALSLRGHGKSEGAESLHQTSYADYVADVAQVAEGFSRPPILIGHSMGGYVVQKYLESYGVAGAILLASVPVSGTLGFNLRVLRRWPSKWFKVNLSRTAYPLMEEPAHAQHWLFSDQISGREMAVFHPKLQDESFRISLDMLALNLPRPKKVSAPLAVIGAELDTIFPPKQIYKTAAAYGVEAKIFPAMPHNMMSMPGWQGVADWIEDWIERL